MGKELYVERMLGVENLTDELEDPQANWLLDWGIARLDAALEHAAGSDPEAAGGQVNALMAVVRKINRMAGARQSASAETLVNDFLALNGLFTAAFGGEQAVTPAECQAAARRLATLSAQQAVEYLADWGLRRRTG